MLIHVGVKAEYQVSSSVALCLFASRLGLSYFSIAVTEHQTKASIEERVYWRLMVSEVKYISTQQRARQ